MTIPIPGLDHLSDEQIFTFCSNVVFIPWLTLVFAPKWKLRSTMVYAVVLMECLVYAVTFVASFRTSEGTAFETFAEMGKLEGVMKLFKNDAVFLPAWIHYLAMDLVVGNHLVERNIADANGLSQSLMFPVLFFALMCCPVGVLLYAVMRTVSGLVGAKPAPKKEE